MCKAGHDIEVSGFLYLQTVETVLKKLIIPTVGCLFGDNVLNLHENWNPIYQ